MKLIVVILGLLMTPMALAVEVTQANQVWNEFRQCRKFSSDSDRLFECTNKTIAQDVANIQKQRMTQFLDIGYEFSELSTCQAGDITPVKPQALTYHFCMKVLGDTSFLKGYVLFDAKAKIVAIKF